MLDEEERAGIRAGDTITWRAKSKLPCRGLALYGTDNGWVVEDRTGRSKARQLIAWAKIIGVTTGRELYDTSRL